MWTKLGITSPLPIPLRFSLLPLPSSSSSSSSSTPSFFVSFSPFFLQTIFVMFSKQLCTESTTLQYVSIVRAIGYGAGTPQGMPTTVVPGLGDGYAIRFAGYLTTWMLRLSGAATDASISSKVCTTCRSSALAFVIMLNNSK